MLRRYGPLTVALLLLAAPLLPADKALYLQARGALFFPADQAFRDIYGGGPVWGGEFGAAITSNVTLWAGVDYYSKNGRLVYTGEETSLRIVPLGAGLKVGIDITPTLRPTLAVGLGYFQYQERNSLGTVEKGDLGFIARAGLAYDLSETFFIALEGTFTACTVKPLRIEASLGGLQVGAGAGFRF
jgi:hypothetical protein